MRNKYTCIPFILLLLFASCAALDFHLPQDKKNNCGQTCVAHITGASVRDVESTFDYHKNDETAGVRNSTTNIEQNKK